MRKSVTIAVFVATVVLVTLSAVPSGGGQNREAIKYGDRFNKWVGQMFFAQPGSGFIRQTDRGSFKLSRVGVDYVELDSGAELLMIPLAELQVLVSKPK